MQIIRGTTPTIQFTFSDVDVSDISVANLYVKQGGTDVITRDITTAEKGEGLISWTLTQDETLALGKVNAKIMCDWLAGEVRGRTHIATASIGEPGSEAVI